MKNLSIEKMETVNGGAYDCLKMVAGFASAVAASMFGPAGIAAGAFGFSYGISRAADCEKSL